LGRFAQGGLFCLELTAEYLHQAKEGIMETKRTRTRLLLGLAWWNNRGQVKKKSHISRLDPTFGQKGGCMMGVFKGLLGVVVTFSLIHLLIPARLAHSAPVIVKFFEVVDLTGPTPLAGSAIGGAPPGKVLLISATGLPLRTNVVTVNFGGISSKSVFAGGPGVLAVVPFLRPGRVNVTIAVDGVESDPVSFEVLRSPRLRGIPGTLTLEFLKQVDRLLEAISLGENTEFTPTPELIEIATGLRSKIAEAIVATGTLQGTELSAIDQIIFVSNLTSQIEQVLASSSVGPTSIVVGSLLGITGTVLSFFPPTAALAVVLRIGAIGIGALGGAIIAYESRAQQPPTPPPTTVTADASETMGGGNRAIAMTAKGTFAGSPSTLQDATVVILSLLNEVGGVGELFRGEGQEELLPITLVGRPVNQTNQGRFESLSRSLRLRMDINLSGLAYNIRLQGAGTSILVNPSACVRGPTARLATSFVIDDGVNPPEVISIEQEYRCLKGQLRAP
jgi:hypothetical protein